MRSEVEVNIRYSDYFALKSEMGRGAFRVPGADPFYFERNQKDDGYAVMFRASSGPAQAGEVLVKGADFLVVTPESVTPRIHARVVEAAQALAQGMRACVEVRRARAQLLKVAAIEMLGPKEVDRKSATLETGARDGLNLASFADYFHKALPGSMAVGEVNEKLHGNFVAKIVLEGQRGVSVPMMTLRHVSGRLETQTLLGDLKARPNLLDAVFDAMRARRQRVLDHRDFQGAMEAVARARAALPPEFVAHFQHSGATHTHSWSSFRMSFLKRREPYILLNEKEAPIRIRLGSGLRADIEVVRGTGRLRAVFLGDEPLAINDEGALPGVPDPMGLWAVSAARVAEARPDLFPFEAERLGVMPEEEQRLRADRIAAEIETALDRPEPAPVEMIPTP